MTHLAIGDRVAVFLPATAWRATRHIVTGRVVTVTARGAVAVENGAGERWSVPAEWTRLEGCVCARHADGSVTTFLCPLHATTDPCLTESTVTGRRRKGTIRRGVCTACGWSA